MFSRSLPTSRLRRTNLASDDPVFTSILYKSSGHLCLLVVVRQRWPRHSVFVVIVLSCLYLREVNRQHLGGIVSHQAHFLAAGKNYERVRTSPDNVSDASAVAIHRIASG